MTDRTLETVESELRDAIVEPETDSAKIDALTAERDILKAADAPAARDAQAIENEIADERAKPSLDLVKIGALLNELNGLNGKPADAANPAGDQQALEGGQDAPEPDFSAT